MPAPRNIVPCFLFAAVLLAAPAARAGDDYVIPPAKKQHWAWQAPVRSAPRA